MKQYYINLMYRDMTVENDGSITAQTLEGWQEEMKCLLISHFQFAWVFGFGYWKDVYSSPYEGHTHNLLLPFCRFQWGYLKIKSK